jgi:long-chain acyl-CoA synthetase
MELIVQALCRHAGANPHKPAVISATTTFTYGELCAHSRSTAAWLAARGVKAQQRVGIFVAPNDPWFAVVYFGVHMAGAIAVPLDIAAPQETVLAIQQRTAPSVVVTGDVLESLKQFVLSGSAADARSVGRSVSADTVAEIVFTSGSTGPPKGVVLTHRNIIAATQNIIAFIGNDQTDREVTTLPLNHSFGLGRLRSNIVAGGTLVLVPGLRYPSLVFRSLTAHRATGLSCVPSGLAVLMRVAGENLSELGAGLRYVELGSERMDPSTKRDVMRLLPATRLCMHYGLTEASRTTFLEFHADAEKLDSVGRPSSNVCVEICNETSKPLPAGETGRVCVKAATVMASYWDDPERTRRVFDDEGRFDTGDLGYIDTAGYLFLQGRSDDVINIGGQKVHPCKVEDAATSYRGVAEAACVAAPDPEGLTAEVPVLYVVKSDGAKIEAAELLQHLATKVDRFAVPRRIRFVNALPRTSSGKLQRRALRAQEQLAGAPGASRDAC